MVSGSRVRSAANATTARDNRRVGHRHFVSDSHHRVSIAAATGQQLIDAYVTQVLTTVPPRTQTARPPRCWR